MLGLKDAISGNTVYVNPKYIVLFHAIVTESSGESDGVTRTYTRMKIDNILREITVIETPEQIIEMITNAENR